MPPFIPSKSFRSTCICSRMPSLAEIEAGACRGDHCLAYVLQEAANVGGTSLFFFLLFENAHCSFSRYLHSSSATQHCILLADFREGWRAPRLRRAPAGGG